VVVSYPSSSTARAVDTPGLLSFFLCLHLLIVGTIHLPPCHVLRQFDTPQFTAGAPRDPAQGHECDEKLRSHNLPKKIKNKLTPVLATPSLKGAGAALWFKLAP
jgi:hypothetical protein